MQEFAQAESLGRTNCSTMESLPQVFRTHCYFPFHLLILLDPTLHWQLLKNFRLSISHRNAEVYYCSVQGGNGLTYLGAKCFKHWRIQRQYQFQRAGCLQSDKKWHSPESSFRYTQVSVGPSNFFCLLSQPCLMSSNSLIWGRDCLRKSEKPYVLDKVSKSRSLDCSFGAWFEPTHIITAFLPTFSPDLTDANEMKGHTPLFDN